MELVKVLATAPVPRGLTQPLPARGQVTTPAKAFGIYERLYRYERIAKPSFPVRTDSVAPQREHSGSEIRILATLMEKHEASILPHQTQPPSPLHLAPSNVCFSFPQMIGALAKTQ